LLTFFQRKTRSAYSHIWDLHDRSQGIGTGIGS
jgi:hypothetical protein